MDDLKIIASGTIACFTATEKRDEARREVEMRKVVYPRQITMGTISPNEAHRRIAIMNEIADDYAKLVEERLL